MSEEIEVLIKQVEKRVILAIRNELGQETREKREEKRYEGKVHNTKLLLRNYKKFKAHCIESQFTAKSLIDKELLEMIRDADNADDNRVYIESIMRTKERTAIMLNHIKRVLDFYEYTASESNDDAFKRRAKALNYKYIKGMTNNEIADKLTIHPRTVDKDIDRAVQEVSPLLFGIDGIKLE
ncbi:hypothetical protein CS063_00010 [Sporanaerobium hydrogeniformans]|uniref:Uncharacterized protein n=1 Tax=Sporanaerobium hydrogeniformans TaxID=3072179 RepID=A0AC61DGV7_9FIRM|nr:hypothetical protein [Sporanaerobium hydrogeniformans]PHV71901.1 hypothetical protein CS063_00010 [Sporanaerobium hydrogeniformans]